MAAFKEAVEPSSEESLVFVRHQIRRVVITDSLLRRMWAHGVHPEVIALLRRRQRREQS